MSLICELKKNVNFKIFFELGTKKGRHPKYLISIKYLFNYLIQVLEKIEKKN